MTSIEHRPQAGTPNLSFGSPMTPARRAEADRQSTVRACGLLGVSPSQTNMRGTIPEEEDENAFQPGERAHFDPPAAPAFTFATPGHSGRMSLKRKIQEFASRRHTLDAGHFVSKLAKTPSAPQVHSRRPADGEVPREVMRDRSNTLTSPDNRIKGKSNRTFSRSTSSKTLLGLGRKSSSKKRKTAKSFFGSPCKRTNLGMGSSMWLETLAENQSDVLSRLGCAEVKRQEAIHELTSSELTYANDLLNVIKVYQVPMVTLRLINETERQAIFSNIQELYAIHKELSDAFTAVRSPTEGVQSLADILASFIPKLRLYGVYCANQAYAKHILANKQRTNDSVLKDLLESASNLKLSRRMDLWTFLDAPRRRLQRYPILLRAVSKYTTDMVEQTKIDASAEQCEAIIRQIEQMVSTTSREKLLKLEESLEFAHSYQKVDLIGDNQPLLALHDVRGKDGKEMRLYVFAHLVLMTKESKHKTPDHEPMRTVVGRPIRMEHLEVEDGAEQQIGLIGRSRSFRGRAQLQASHDDTATNADTLVLLRNNDPSLMRGSFRGHKSLLQASSGKTYALQFASVADKSQLLSTLTRAKLDWSLGQVQTLMEVDETQDPDTSPSSLLHICRV